MVRVSSRNTVVPFMGKTVAGIISLLQELNNEKAFVTGEMEQALRMLVMSGLWSGCCISPCFRASEHFILFVTTSTKAGICCVCVCCPHPGDFQDTIHTGKGTRFCPCEVKLALCACSVFSSGHSAWTSELAQVLGCLPVLDAPLTWEAVARHRQVFQTKGSWKMCGFQSLFL